MLGKVVSHQVESECSDCIQVIFSGYAKGVDAYKRIKRRQNIIFKKI